MQRPILPRPALLPILARHRGFLSRLAGGSRPAMPAVPVTQVLRRPQRLVLQRLALHVQAHPVWRIAVHQQAVLQRIVPPAPMQVTLQQPLLRLLRERGVERPLLHSHTERHAQHTQRLLQLVAAPAPVPGSAAQGVALRVQVQQAYPKLSTAVAPWAGVRHSGPDAPAAARSPDIASVRAGDAARSAAAPTSAAWPPPPLELARFTAAVSHQVVQQLERSALSARERSGRV